MIHDSVSIQVRRIVATRIVVSLIFMAPLLLTGASLLSCTKSDSNRDGVDDWMDVSVDGDVSVSLWRTDGEPLGYYETNTPPAGSSVQHFDIYTSNPVIIRLEINQDGPVKMDVIPGECDGHQAGPGTSPAPPGGLRGVLTFTCSRSADQGPLVGHRSALPLDAAKACEDRDPF